MEKIMELLVANADNARMAVVLTAILFGYFELNKKLSFLDKRIDGVEVSLGKRIDGVEVSLGKRIDELKYNDIAHLGEAIKTLTFTLEKNKSLEKKDREYIDGKLG